MHSYLAARPIRPCKIDDEISGSNLEFWCGKRGFDFISYICKSPMQHNFIFWYILKQVKIFWYLKKRLEFANFLLIVMTKNPLNTSLTNLLSSYSFYCIILFAVKLLPTTKVQIYYKINFVTCILREQKIS